LQRVRLVTLRFKARWLARRPKHFCALNGNWMEGARHAMAVPANLGTVRASGIAAP